MRFGKSYESIGDKSVDDESFNEYANDEPVSEPIAHETVIRVMARLVNCIN